jgi:hypothetical protein
MVCDSQAQSRPLTYLAAQLPALPPGSGCVTALGRRTHPLPEPERRLARPKVGPGGWLLIAKIPCPRVPLRGHETANRGYQRSVDQDHAGGHIWALTCGDAGQRTGPGDRDRTGTVSLEIRGSDEQSRAARTVVRRTGTGPTLSQVSQCTWRYGSGWLSAQRASRLASSFAIAPGIGRKRALQSEHHRRTNRSSAPRGIQHGDEVDGVLGSCGIRVCLRQRRRKVSCDCSRDPVYCPS